jgi:hypothetical protein
MEFGVFLPPDNRFPGKWMPDDKNGREKQMACQWER